jgi:predicted aldo/keto reductase-like oxidoreductase
MEKIRFGKTNLLVSRVALGGIPIMRVSKAEATKLVQKAVDLGINFIDTAHVYGYSEEKIGEGIKSMRREDLVIASKSTADDKKTFNEQLDLSFKRLGVDYIDIYQLHNVGSPARRDAVLAPGGALEGLLEAVKAGKVRHAAFSSHSLPVALELAKSGHFAALQFPFNYMDNEAAKELIPLAKKLDMGFIAMKPMGGGLLDNAGLSFRYLLQFDSIVPDPGIERLEEIVEIAGIVEENKSLSDADKKEIVKLRTEFGPSWCHRCDYCQPCPQKIPISAVMGVKSNMKRFSPDRSRAMLEPGIEKARSCLECGDCMTRCPYHLEIPRLIKENIAYWDRECAG